MPERESEGGLTMPAPMFTCCVCGSQVSRPKSYAMPNGQRACRIHQEAQDAHQKADQKKVLDEQVGEDRERHHSQRELGYDILKHLVPACQLCERPGILARDFFLRQIIASQRLTQSEEKLEPMFIVEGVNVSMNPKHIEQMKKHLAPPGDPCPERYTRPLFFVPRDKRNLSTKLPNKFLMMYDFIGGINLCMDCAKSVGVMDYIDELMRPKVAPENLETLMMIGAIAETFTKPIAEEELKADSAIKILKN